MSRELLTKIKELRSKERLIKPDEAWLRATREGLLLRARRALPPRPQVSGFGMVKEVVRAAFPQGVVQYVSRPVFATLSLVVAAMGGSMMSVSAAERSLPGEFLYSLKLVTEQARLVMATAKDEKLKLKTEFTGRRVEELRRVTTGTTPDPQKVVEMAVVLKRDMDTLKQQLVEVSAEVPAAAAVEAAKSVDKQTNEVIVALQETKQQLPPETKEKVTEAQSAAAETSVKAIEVLAVKHQESADAVSVAEVTEAIKEHAKTVSAVTEVPLPVNATSTASGTTIITITGPATTTSSTPLSLELGTATGTAAGSATGTPAMLPGLLDQVKDATAQAFALQKAKDQQAVTAAQQAAQQSTEQIVTSTPSVPAPSNASGTPVNAPTSTTPAPDTSQTTSTKK